MKPYVVCHMQSSIDGSLHPSRFTRSAQGGPRDWSEVYERMHGELGGQGWIVGRVTMAEMSKAGAHPPAAFSTPARPAHFADRKAGSYAIAVDRSGKLHFAKPDIGGDHVVVLLGGDVADSHLAELAGDGVSYLTADGPTLDLKAMLETLGRELRIDRLLLEGGATINGAFLAAGLVDELSVLVAPALDGRAGAQSCFELGAKGLQGRVELALVGVNALEHGLVHLRYRVTAAG